MISVQGIGKRYRMQNGWRHVLRDVNYDFAPGVNVGILGRNGSGKSTFMRMIGGAELPDSGRILRSGKVSWPLGFRVGFNKDLTGRENLKFVCRLYKEDYKRVCDFVSDFSELGEYMDMPIRTYSSGMSAKLTFGVTMAFEFDYYLIDELTAVGDAVFQRKSSAFFDERRARSTLIVVSHSMRTIKKFCDKMLVLHQGGLHEFASNEEAETFYNEVCCGLVPEKPAVCEQ